MTGFGLWSKNTTFLAGIEKEHVQHLITEATASSLFLVKT